MPLISNKACELSDFRDPELRGWMREIFAHEITRFGPSFPDGVEYRKHWEIAMTALALSRAGALNGGAEILGVGAGNEPTLFWLTRHVRRVLPNPLGSHAVRGNGDFLCRNCVVHRAGGGTMGRCDHVLAAGMRELRQVVVVRSVDSALVPS
jgi:hypothetical protein